MEEVKEGETGELSDWELMRFAFKISAPPPPHNYFQIILHLLAEDAQGVVGLLSRQLLLDAANPAHLVDEREVPTEVPHEELRGLAADPSCVATRK